MKNINRVLCFFLVALLFTSCSKSVEDDNVEVPETIEITSLVFKKDLNPSLSNDIQLEEKAGQFTAKLPKYIDKNLILTYQTNATKVIVNDVEQSSGVTKGDFTNLVNYSFLGSKGGKKEISIKLNWSDFEIPHISIDVDGGAEINSKEVYLNATVDIDGNELYPNFTGSTEIRGRGNFSWNSPKKPYRLKLNNKSEILGLPAAKNWVLLANYYDPSLMCNVVANKIARELQVPFTNHLIPVDLTINGKYRGSYLLTEQVEVKENRIVVGDDGYLLELDRYFDEDYKFRSENYNLPVNVKYPELTSNAALEIIKNDFNNFERKVFASDFPNNNYADLFDVDVFVRYMLVYFITGNEEINDPKSAYLHKKPGGKYTFGPVWDFDIAFGAYPSFRYFIDPNRNLFKRNLAGSKFFTRILEDPKVKTAFKNEWMNFKQNKFNDLLKYIDEYASLIKTSKESDVVIWEKGTNFESEVSKLKKYLQDRIVYMDNYVASF